MSAALCTGCPLCLSLGTGTFSGSAPPTRPPSTARLTRASFVDACDGQYADALAKGHGVNLLHAETTGALGAIFMTVLRVLAKQSRLPGATDFTQYGEGRASPKAFLTHHVASISTAIQAADAHTVLAAASTRALRQSLGLD